MPLPSRLLCLPTEGDLFSQKTEVWVVTEKTQHDQIGVQSIQTVSGVRVAGGELLLGEDMDGSLIRLSFAQPNEFLNLVLSLSRNVVSTEDHLDVPPLCVLGDSLGNVVFQVI